MTVRRKYPALQLRKSNYKIVEREACEHIRIAGVLQIDRSIFKKSKAEKLLLKVAKAQAKEDDLHN